MDGSSRTGNAASRCLTRREFLAAFASGTAALGCASLAFAATSPDLVANPPYCRFTRVVMNDYGCFRGLNVITFAPGQNYVIAPNGSGKTTIARTLAILGTSPDRLGHVGVPSPRPYVDVAVDGNPQLIEKFRNLIFITEENSRLPFQSDFFTGLDRAKLEQEAQRIYLEFFPYRKHALVGRRLDELISARSFGTGEVMMARYAYVFAARYLLEVELPLVLDSPFSSLDLLHRRELSRLLDGLSCQVIVMATESQLQAVTMSGNVWRIERHCDFSRVVGRYS